MSSRLSLRVRRGAASPELAPPTSDAAVDALGDLLFGRLATALASSRPGPAALALWENTVQQVELGPAAAEGAQVAHQVLAAIAGQPGCRALCLLAVLGAQSRGGPARPCATVFVELPDNRWWMRWAPLDTAQGVHGPPHVRAAVDGWPKPAMLGGWFSLARRTGIQLQLHAPGGEQPGLHLVH